MKKSVTQALIGLILAFMAQSLCAQERRPVDNQHPLWFIHVDVWYRADPQKIIDLIPDEVKPYVCMNLSLSCQYDKDLNIYKMPQYAFQTYKSWGTVCQKNGVWFSCQPASGGHTHIQDNDLATFEYFFKKFPNFLGWNYAEQFWGFDEPGDKSSSPQTSRWALFAKLVEMSHKYGGFLTVSFCGNIWSHALNPLGEMKRNKDLMEACKKYPEAILWLYKYTTSSCFYNNESVTFGPFISGLAKNYGVRYDNCGWNGALSSILGENHGKKYPGAAGIGTVMEQSCVNGGAVWDGPELTWSEECFHEVGRATVDGYQRRQWERFPHFDYIWLDMYKKILDGTLYIPTREEVVEKTKIVVINDVSSGSDEDKYAAWGDLYDGIYKQTDPFNRNSGQWMDNFCYFKSTGRYGAIPIVTGLYDDLAKAIPVQVKKSQRSSKWSSLTKKKNDFNAQYPVVSTGDLYVNRFRNQLVTYTPFTYLNKKTKASAVIPLQYNTCESLELTWGKLSSGLIREYADSIVFYLNNYRKDSTAVRTDTILIHGVKGEPSYKLTKHKVGKTTITGSVKALYENGDYKLTVKHNGALDLIVYCSGDADRSEAGEPIAIKPLPMPKLPELYRGPIIIEAEDMDYANVSACIVDGYGHNGGAFRSIRYNSGNGFVNMGTNKSGALRHKLTLKEGQEGEYRIDVRYTSKKAGNLKVAINGVTMYTECEKTGDSDWRRASVKGTMKVGENTLVITNSSGLSMMIDQIVYQPTDVEEMKYYITVNDTDRGTLIPNVTEAAEGDTITLTVNAAEHFALSELRVINSVFFTLEKTIDINGDGNKVTFVMPNDNVTLQPVFKDATAIYGLDFENVVSGMMPAGWRTADGTDIHEYNGSYSSGSRTMSGFGGYQGKGLYWRNTNAEYGRQSAYPLTLQPGDYTVTWAMAAWKGSPKYVMSLVDGDDNAVVESEVLTAAPNANGNTGANLSKAVEYTLPFTITDEGKYYITFTDKTTTGGFHEFLILECSIHLANVPTSIARYPAPATGDGVTLVYDLQGRRIASKTIGKGMRIIRTPDGKTRKVMVK